MKAYLIFVSLLTALMLCAAMGQMVAAADATPAPISTSSSTATPSPTAPPSPAATASPELGAPSPTPEPLLVNGQLIDLERGYAVFASGDALRLAPNAGVIDDTTGAVPKYAIDPGLYAVATIDSVSGMVLTLRTSHKPLNIGVPIAQAPRRYVIVASEWRPNPDLAPPAIEYIGNGLSKAIGVVVTVEVPPETPYNDSIYLATDTSGWNPQAVKMQRLDGLHFRIVMEVPPGTELHYLFTRGTWNNVERDRAGLQRKPRVLAVRGGDVRVIDATVYRWADQP